MTDQNKEKRRNYRLYFGVGFVVFVLAIVLILPFSPALAEYNTLLWKTLDPTGTIYRESGDVVIGDTTTSGTLTLDVEGQVGATEYCDEDGNNCTAAGSLGGTDSQTLSFTSPNLSISGGNSVDISAINTDAQDLTLTGDTLSLTNDASTVDLSGYIDSPADANGAVQFNNSGSFGGDAANLFWDNTSKELGIGTSAPNATLAVTGDSDLNGNLAVGANAAINANEVLTVEKNHNNTNNTYQIYSSTTQTSPLLTGDRTSYGMYMNLVNNKTENIAGGLDSDALAAYLAVSTSGANTFRTNRGLLAYVDNSSTVADTGTTIEGANINVRHLTSVGAASTARGLYTQVRGSTTVGGTSTIVNARGVNSDVYAYETDITTAYGGYFNTQTNNGDDGSITNATGVYGRAYADSDDLSSKITTGRAGQFIVGKRGTTESNKMTNAYGIEVDAQGGTTVYGAHIDANAGFLQDVTLNPISNVYGAYILADDTNALSNTALRLSARLGDTNRAIWSEYGDWYLQRDDFLIGTTVASGALRVDVHGDVGAQRYCDEAGNNCTAPTDLGGAETFLELTDTPATYSAGSIYFAGAADVTEDNANLFWDDTNNRLGIGTAVPGSALDVASGNIRITDENINRGLQWSNGASIRYDNDAATNNMVLNTRTGKNVLFQDGGSGTNLFIEGSSGEVGIGTSTPNALLAVAGDAYIDGQIEGSNRFLVDYPTTGVYDDATSNSPYSRVNADSLHTNGNGVGQLYLEGRAIDGNSSIYIGGGNAGGQTTTDVFLGDNNELVVDTSANAVGIGDTTPDLALKLDVEGQIGATEYCDEDGLNCTAAASLGTPTLEEVLAVGNTTGANDIIATGRTIDQAAFYDVQSGTGNGLRFWNSDTYKVSMGDDADYHYGPVTSHSIKSNMGGANRGFTWGTNGNVPTAALTNTGTMQLAANLYAMGNAGIGTSAPATRLQLGTDGGGQSNYMTIGKGWDTHSGINWQRGGLLDAQIRVNASEDFIFETNPTGTGINGQFVFQNNNTNIARITPAGLMAIGAAAPTAALHIQEGTSDASPNVTGIQIANGANPSIEMTSNGGRPYIDFQNDISGTDMDMRIILEGNDMMQIGGGNLGIGTATPGERLTVDGNIYAVDGTVGSSDSGLTHISQPVGAALNGSGTQTGAIKIELPNTWTNTMMKMNIEVYDYTTNESFTVKVGGYTYLTGTSWYNTSAQIIANKTDRDFTVRFGHDGTHAAIWIGETTSTWSYPKVSVTDFYAGHSANTFENWDDGWDITIDNSFTGDTMTRTHNNNLVGLWRANGDDIYKANPANVGIGITTPGSELHVYENSTNTGNSAGITMQQAGTGDARLGLNVAATSWSVGVDNSDADKFKIGDNGVVGTGTVMTMETNGEVGIGTTTPAERLHVTGSIRANSQSSIYVGDGIGAGTQRLRIHHNTNTHNYIDYGTGELYFRKSDAGTVMTMEANGEVGIGTTNPTQQLELTGNLEIPNTTSSSTGVIYHGATRFMHNYNSPGGTANPAGRNLFIGNASGNFTMGSTATSVIHASYNVGVGDATLQDLTTGYDNTALGDGAAQNVTAGFDNSVFGSEALLTNTTGDANTAVGSQTLRNLTTANNNTAIGTGAAQNLTTGADNVAIGADAGKWYDNSGGTVGNNTTSLNSIYIGHNARGYANGGNNEIVIGDQGRGLGSNTTVIGNTSTSKTVLRSGYLGLGLVNPGFKIDLPNNANNSGRGRANQWTTYSSIRWKENIRPIDNALEKVMQMQGVSYDWKEEHGGVADIGFVAEDVGKIIPEIVNWEDDGSGFAMGLGYDRITALNLQAIKELKEEKDADIAGIREEKEREIKELREENELLRSDLENLVQRVQSLEASQ